MWFKKLRYPESWHDRMDKLESGTHVLIRDMTNKTEFMNVMWMSGHMGQHFIVDLDTIEPIPEFNRKNDLIILRHSNVIDEERLKKYERIIKRKNAQKYFIKCVEGNKYQVFAGESYTSNGVRGWSTYDYILRCSGQFVAYDEEAKRRNQKMFTFKTTEEAEATIQKSIWLRAIEILKNKREKKNSYQVPPFKHR